MKGTVNYLKEVITRYSFAVYIAVISPMSGVQLLQQPHEDMKNKKMEQCVLK